MASKTARRSSPQLGKNATPEQVVAGAATSPFDRLVSLNGGRHCYLANPLTGANMHLATDSDEFAAVVAELSALGLGDRLRAEMTAFAEQRPTSVWPSVLERLDAALSGEGATSDEG